MLLEKLESVAAGTPSSPAVVAGDCRLSYGDLAQRSTALARHLVQNGIGSGDVVAVYTRRSVDALVGLIGVMKAGAAYTVVEDDGHVAENCSRLQSIAPTLVLYEEGDQRTALASTGLRTIGLGEALASHADAALPPTRGAEDPAYVLFTSGSTGTPKGVVVTHGNIAHYTGAMADLLGIDSPLRYAHVSTLAADLGNTSLFLSLWSGGCLHLIDAEMRRDPAALRDYLVSREIQFVKITPSHWNAIFANLGERQLEQLKLHYLVLGGEVLPVSLARRILASKAVRVLLNHYGPTETTVGVCTFPVFEPGRLESLTDDSVPIGFPLGSSELRVRTEDGRFCARDARGELYIGGPSVATGYLNDPATTAKSFVTLNEPGAVGRFYKTGDHVSIDGAGITQFLGRVDRQIKVNGYRVELEHVESLLRAAPDVADAATFFLPLHGKQRIVAAVLGGGDGFDSLKRHLADVMPEYMIPRLFVRMDDFPRNDNGKTNLKLLQAKLEVQLRSTTLKVEPAPTEDVLTADIRRVWATYLHRESFGADESFFDLGGDSLDAIQVIADLQMKGHHVTTNTFLAHPTLAGLRQAIQLKAGQADAPVPEDLRLEARTLSAAQDFFFRQALADADHYNQALLLECGERVDPEALRRVLVKLVQEHPSLRMAYERDAQGMVARPVASDAAAVLGVSVPVSQASDADIEGHIEAVAQGVQQSMSLAEGRLFAAHLFKLESGRDQLLLVAHHVAVDVVSWRILITELVRHYAQLRAGGPAAESPPARHAFWDWVQHLDDSRATLYGNADRWLAQATNATGHIAGQVDPDNLEGSAQTLWLGFSRRETKLLMRDLVDALNSPFHHVLLAAFATTLARSQGVDELVIDMESHGRVSLDDTVDVSRVVGWHTSTYPLMVQVDDHIAATLGSVLAATQQVPDLGVAYGVREKETGTGPARPSAAVCFNYLGEFYFNRDDRLTLTPSRYAIGRARGDRNHRGHALKLTARVVDGHLVADLSYPGAADPQRMTALMSELKRSLLALLGEEADTTSIFAEPGTRNGLISYVPRQLALEAAEESSAARRDYRNVLVTGATGYVGVHVLKELFDQSAAHVVCLVRGKDGRTGEERLRESFDSYFPETPLRHFEGRWSVLQGDIALQHLGLAPDAFEQLAATVDAIYHLAADTRLFGPEEEFRRHNVAPVQAFIAFAQHKRPKDLHYVSTLAVCGVNGKAEAVEFAEDSMNIGQEFQNHYESTKYLAEGLVKRFDADGPRGFIYRLGNVSGHSQTGRFQRNAKDNRLVQFLAACAKLGRLPRALGEAVVLSPVDEVAAGLVAISLDGLSAGGTYHVDSTQPTSMGTLFDALGGLGIAFEQTGHADYLSLFNAVRDTQDSDLALGHFWATRRPRNVVYSHERTQRTLRRLGRGFSPTDSTWLSRFVHSLAEAGAFPSAATPCLSSRKPARKINMSTPNPSSVARQDDDLESDFDMDTLNPSFVLSPDDITRYRETGFVLLKQFFTGEYIEYLRGKVRAELENPTDHYQKGFDKLGYDLCEGDAGVYSLLENQRFRDIMMALSGKKLFFTQGVGFGMKKNVSKGFDWHIESQSFGFHRTEDYATTIWAPLDPITRAQRGGMRYVPTNIISGEYMYSHVDRAVFRCIQERIDAGGLAFEDYVALRDGPLNSEGMNRLLEFFAVEDDFAIGDILLFDKFVMHKSVKLEDGPMDSRDAFSFRFIDEDSRYDHHRAHMIEIPRNYFNYPGPTKFHLDICKEDGEMIIDSPFFHDRERRRLAT